MNYSLLAKLVWAQHKSIVCPLCGEVVVPIDIKIIPLKLEKCHIQIYSICCNPKCRHIEGLGGVFDRDKIIY